MRAHGLIIAAAVLSLLVASGVTPADEPPGKDEPVVRMHMARLLSADPMVRLRAAKALGEMGLRAKLAIGALEKLASDPDADVRGVAARALEKIRAVDRSAARELIKKLADEDPIVRLQAAKALGKMGPDARVAIPALEALAADPDEDVRRVAANALKKTRASADPAVRALIEELRSEDAITRLQAAKKLGEVGAAAEPAISALEALAADPDEDVRRVAASALKRIRMSLSREPLTPALRELIAALKSPDKAVRMQAVAALGRLGPKAAPALRYLEEVMDDSDPEIRIAVAEAITIIRSTATLRPGAVAGVYVGAKLKDQDILSPLWKEREPQRGLLPPGYAVKSPEEARALIRTILEGAQWTIDKAGLLTVKVTLPEGWERAYGDRTIRLGGSIEPEGSDLRLLLRFDGKNLGTSMWLEGTVSSPDVDLVAEVKLSTVGANLLSAKVLQRLEPATGGPKKQ